MYPLPSRLSIALLLLTAACGVLAPPAMAACNDFVADFMYDVGTPPDGPPYPVTFTDASQPAAGQPLRSVGYQWGDGYSSASPVSGSGTSKSHSFATDGSFTVIMTATSTCGKSESKTKTVRVVCSKPVAGFFINTHEGVAPLTVRITDSTLHLTSTGTSWEYISDHVRFSTQPDTQITFPTPGTYDITQVVKKTCNPVPDVATRTITVRAAVSTYTIMNLSGLSVGSPTTTVTTTVTPTVTTTVATTPAPPAPVVPVYADTTAVSVTTAPATTQAVSATQQAGTTGSSPAPSQASGAPAAAAPGTGTLSVVTNPAGAEVSVDGMMWGATPATIPGLTAGTHTLRLEMASYRNMSVPITINDGKTAEYSFTLVPESGGGMGMLPVIAGILVIAAIAGAAVWYFRKKATASSEQK